MKFKNGADIVGTSKQGSVTINYSKLVKIFGEPDFGPSDDSGGGITCEWRLQFEDGVVATIYDWNEMKTSFGDYQWKIGGKSLDAVDHVMNEIVDFNNIDPLAELMKVVVQGKLPHETV